MEKYYDKSKARDEIKIDKEDYRHFLKLKSTTQKSLGPILPYNYV